MAEVEPTQSTATTHAARDHARAQAGATTTFQRTIPASNAASAPDGAEALWEENVEGGNYSSAVLPRGSRLQLTDTDGDTCVQLLVFNHRQPSERINVADIVKVQWQAYLSTGQLILSDMGRVLMTIEDDSSAGHDTFNAISNRAFNTRKYGDGRVSGPYPNARDQFAVALTKIGLGRQAIAPALNMFKPVTVAPDGSFIWPTDPCPPGASVTLRAEMDVRVALTVTPHVLDPRPTYTVSPLHIVSWLGDPTAHDDRWRTATPEGRRAFQNTEDWLRSGQRRTSSFLETP